MEITYCKLWAWAILKTTHTNLMREHAWVDVSGMRGVVVQVVFSIRDLHCCFLLVLSRRLLASNVCATSLRFVYFFRTTESQSNRDIIDQAGERLANNIFGGRMAVLLSSVVL